jgi:hypothetical protein
MRRLDPQSDIGRIQLSRNDSRIDSTSVNCLKPSLINTAYSHLVDNLVTTSVREPSVAECWWCLLNYERRSDSVYGATGEVCRPSARETV